MSRETLFLLVFSLLAVGGISASYQWMETHHTLDSNQAATQVLPIVQELSQERKQPLRLANVIPPSASNTHWRFEFQPQAGSTKADSKKAPASVGILVQENGQTSLVR